MTDLFKKTASNDGQTTDNQDNVDPMEYVSQKFKNEKGELDIQALAKAKFEADRFITKLEGETDGLRTELNTRLTLEEFMNEIKRTSSSSTNNQADNRSGNQSDDDQSDGPRNGISSKEIEDLINSKLNQTQQKLAQERNVEYVASELEKTWGKNYQEKLVGKAKDLGLSQEFLAGLAATQPKAFLALTVGTTPQGTQNTPGTNFTPPQNNVNPRSFTGNPNKNFYHYEKMRKEDPRTYWSRETQRELHKQAMEQGEKFYQR